MNEWMNKQMNKQIGKQTNNKRLVLKKGQIDRLCQEKCVSKFSKNN